MKRYLYILIIISIFLCVCLFCKGCIDIYDGFSVGGQFSEQNDNKINISQNLILNTGDFDCKTPSPPSPPPSPPSPPPSTDYKIICKGPGSSVTKDLEGCNCINASKVNCSFTCLNSSGETVKYNYDENIFDCRLNNSTLIRGCGENSKGFTSDITTTCIDDPCNPNPCQNGGTCSNDDGNAKCQCPDGYTGDNCEIKPIDVPSIEDIPNQSILIVNNTTDNFSIFIMISDQVNVQYLNHLKIDDTNSSPNCKQSDIIIWGSNPNLKAWHPIGSGSSIQIIIPINGWVTFNNPIPVPSGVSDFYDQIVLWPIKFKKEYSDKFITSFDGGTTHPEEILKQEPIKFELGNKVVSDSSAVDGINYKFKYEITSCDENPNFHNNPSCNNNKILYTEMKENPCSNMDPKYSKELDVGCYSPPKLDCGTNLRTYNQSTEHCIEKTQNCAINECSKLFFNTSNVFTVDEINNYTYPNHDGGRSNQKAVDGFGPVKYNLGIRGLDNLNDTNGQQLKKYCDKVQGTGDFTSYCFDYNDESSSKILIEPYKIKITFSDLQ